MLSYYRFDWDGVARKTIGSQRKWAPIPADWNPWSECLQLSLSPFNRLSQQLLLWPSSVLDFLPPVSPAHQPLYDSVQISDVEYSPSSVIEDFKACLPPSFLMWFLKVGTVPHSNHLWPFHQCLIEGELFFIALKDSQGFQERQKLVNDVTFGVQ